MCQNVIQAIFAFVSHYCCVTVLLQRHFYWPGVTTDIKQYCRTCDVCQKLGKGGPAPVAPLQSLPLVTEPFCQVAIDNSRSLATL